MADLMGKAKRSQEMIESGMGLVNGIILYHYATSIPKAVALNSKEMQLILNKEVDQNWAWDVMCDSVMHRIGLDIQDGNWELEKLVVGGESRPLH